MDLIQFFARRLKNICFQLQLHRPVTVSTNYYLPEEIIFIILSWLPVKSLLRFSSVCKSWQSIISNEQFILIHLNNSKKKSASVLIYPKPILHPDGAYADSLVYIYNREDCFYFSPPLPPQYNDSTYRLCSCNGLVFITNKHGDFACMWNIATRKFKILPAPNKPSYFHEYWLGFGFDSVSNDYKILKIVLSDVSTVREVELYSANTDSWKEIEVPSTLQSLVTFKYNNKCVCTKTGVLYWKTDHGLMSFDLHNEVFGLYPYHDSTGISLYLFDFEGSAAMIYKSCDAWIYESLDGSVYGLWVLDDSCGKLSWTKKFILEDEYLKYFAVLYSGVYLMIIDDDFFPYTESLVSLEGFKPQE